jgi:hypothetical protein
VVQGNLVLVDQQLLLLDQVVKAVRFAFPQATDVLRRVVQCRLEVAHQVVL